MFKRYFSQIFTLPFIPFFEKGGEHHLCLCQSGLKRSERVLGSSDMIFKGSNPSFSFSRDAFLCRAFSGSQIWQFFAGYWLAAAYSPFLLILLCTEFSWVLSMYEYITTFRYASFVPIWSFANDQYHWFIGIGARAAPRVWHWVDGIGTLGRGGGGRDGVVTTFFLVLGDHDHNPTYPKFRFLIGFRPLNLWKSR